MFLKQGQDFGPNVIIPCHENNVYGKAPLKNFRVLDEKLGKNPSFSERVCFILPLLVESTIFVDEQLTSLDAVSDITGWWFSHNKYYMELGFHCSNFKTMSKPTKCFHILRMKIQLQIRVHCLDKEFLETGKTSW